VILDSRAAEFISADGPGIKIAEGTFNEPVMVGIYKETDPLVLAPMAEGFQRLGALRVDFGGVIPNKPFKLSIAAPPTPPDPNSPITPDSQLFIANEVEVFGQKKLMVVDTAALKDNNTRIETNSPPWPGCSAEGIYTMMINSIYQLSYITGMVGSVGAAVMCMDLVFITSGPQFIMPIPINRNVTLTARDLTTGETIFKQDLTGPTMQGQVYNFGVASNDKECPTVTGVTGLTVMGFDVTGQRMESRGITITPQLDGGLVNSILVEGVDGTTLETFAYDGLSRLSSAVDDDAAIEYGYDPASRKTWRKQLGKLIEYTYDKVNNPLSVKYPNSRLIEREFDALSRIKKIKQGTVGIAEMNHIGRSFRLLSKQYGNGDLISYLYDNGRRLTGLDAKNKNSDLINKYVYGYNRVGMKMFEQRGHNGNKGDAFSYDGVYRLTGMKFNSPEPQNPATILFEKQKAINLDKVYNIMSIVESQDGLTNTINTNIPEGSTYSKLNQYERFDQWGLSYDLNGNTTQKGTQHFTYDYRNQLVRAVGVNTTTDFKYDPLGHRIKKIVSTGSQGKTSQYFYDGDQLIEERDGNDNVLRQFVYGNGVDEIIRMDKYEGATVTSYCFHTDANGSVTSITDADGNLVERVTYDTYGMPTFWDPTGNVIPESLIGNNILFQGREYDKETNLYYYRARYYDPIMGRFLQTDPMGYQDSMNLYQAFNMNPVNFVDPMGLEWLYSKENLGTLEGEWNYYPGFAKKDVTYRYLVIVKNGSFSF
jgi:RHS repeat-associated protein